MLNNDGLGLAAAGAARTLGDAILGINVHGITTDFAGFEAAIQSWETVVQQGRQSVAALDFRGMATGLNDAVTELGSRLSQVNYQGLLVGLDDVKNAGADAHTALTQGFDQLLQGDYQAAAGNVGPLVNSLSTLKQAGADVLTALAPLKLNIDMGPALTSLPEVQRSLSGLVETGRGAAADLSNLWQQGQSLAAAAGGTWASLKSGDLGGTVTGLQGLVKGFVDAKDTASGLTGHLQGFFRSAGDAKGSITQMGGDISNWTQQSGLASMATKAWSSVTGVFNAVMDASPIVWIILAVVALAAGIYLAVKYWDDWTGAIKTSWAMMVDWFNGISGWGDAIAGFFAPLLSIPDTIAQSWGSFKQFFVGVWDEVNVIWQMLGDWLIGLSGWGEAILGFFAPFLAIPLMIAENWGAIKQFFMGLWDELQVMWQMLSDWWTGKISTWDMFAGLWDRLKGWGANLLNMLADGIQAAWNGLSGTVKKTADILFNFLGFHSPAKMGPGADADHWTPNLMSMYAGGIEAGIPEIRAAGTQAATAMSVTLTPALAPAAPTAPVPAGMPADALMEQDSSGTPARQQLLTVVAKLVLPDGRELAETIIPVLREGALLGFRG